jgi:hypothetical protein
MRALLVLFCAARARAVGYCNDKSTSCAGWAKTGECAGKNAEYLALLCPHSCSTCTHSCEDTDVSCGNWAKNGDCKSNRDFMIKACPTSCGLCTPTCKDAHEQCATWTSAGACAQQIQIRPVPPRGGSEQC